MKKYFVQVNVTFTEEDGREEYTKMYECNGFGFAKKWGWDSIRLDEVNTLDIIKGKEKRKEHKRGVYVIVDMMPHWAENIVNVYDNETKELVWTNK